MKLKVYAIYDRQTTQYSNPMFLTAHGQAIRAFSDEVNRSEQTNMLYLHPDDYDLYHLGEWDTDSALFECGQPQQIAVGSNLKR